MGTMQRYSNTLKTSNEKINSAANNLMSFRKWYQEENGDNSCTASNLEMCLFEY